MIEEKILNEANLYSNDKSNSIVAENAFIAGANYVRSAIWHDAKEEPQGDWKIIALSKPEHFFALSKNKMLALQYKNWKELLKHYDYVDYWAYVEDLQPVAIGL